MKVEIRPEKAEKIEKYVKEGRFESAEAFVEQAVTLLLYAEDNRNMFEQLVKQNKDEPQK